MAKKPKNHKKPWTKAQENKLKADAKRDVATTSIAKALGRTEASVRAKAQALKVSLKRPN